MRHSPESITHIIKSSKLRNPAFTWIYDRLETRLYIQNPENEYSANFESYLFNTAKHQNTQASQAFYTFCLLRLPESRVIASISFVKKSGNTFISPAKAPFGGIQRHPDCNAYELTFFISCIEKWAQKNNVTSLTIKSAPTCYDPVFHNLLHSIYLTGKYQATEQINHHIEITNRVFTQRIKKCECRRLIKCKNAGFTVGLDQTSSSQNIYQFIRDSFLTRQYKLSISEDQFNILTTTFPKEILVFSVRDAHQLIAVCVTVRVCKNVLYNFIPTDLLSYRRFSPMVLLFEEIYNYCQKEGIEIWDLGTSNDHHGIIKPGLVCFKENIGGVKSLKICYHKVLT